MMKKFIYSYQKNEGYIIFDFLLVLFLFCSIYLTILSLFNIEIKKYEHINSKIVQKKEDNFILDYLEKDILESHYILKTEEIRNFKLYFPKNLNYIFVKRLDNSLKYTTYVLENNRLKRLSIQADKVPNPIYFKKYGGNNILSYNFKDIGIYIEEEHIIIRIQSNDNEILERFINLKGRDYENSAR